MEITRTIDELIMQYELEPSLRDFIVEGQFDLSIISNFLSSEGASASVYEVAVFEIPVDKILALGLPDNNRGRVITLINELVEHFGVCMAQCTGIIDTDFDVLNGISRESDCLLTTDFTCMEMYLFDERFLAQFLSGYLGSRGLSVEDIIRPIAQLLNVRFLIRHSSDGSRFQCVALAIRRR